MFGIYRDIFPQAIRRAYVSWPAALSLVVYGAILFVVGLFTSGLGIVGGLILGLVMAGCWSSYLELISQAVTAPRFSISWDEFRQTFLVRFGDVISVMFAFFILSFVTGPLTSQGRQGPALAGILGFAMAFFFNAVPELLYQGRSRSFSLLLESAQFVMNHPVVWMLPNVVFAAGLVAAYGGGSVNHPGELLVLFGSLFSSPLGIGGAVMSLPVWSWPIVLLVLHFAMVFRGLLFDALSNGRHNPRLRAFQNPRGR